MTIKNCTVLLLKKDNQILLAMKKRGFGSDRYNGVGGKIEPGETVEEALVRECREEIRVTPTNYWKVAEHDFLQDSDTNPWHMYVHVYLCDEWIGEPRETEEMAPEWFAIEDIPYETMWEDDVYWLPLVIGGQKVFGTFTFDKDDKLLTHNVSVVEVLPHEKLAA